MISTDITGNAGGDASQVFNLLAVVANPDAYGAKLKALVEATEEHKKFIALVAPAAEIRKIREEIEGDKALAKQELKDAKREADKAKADAKAAAKVTTDKADKVLVDAQEQAAKTVADAQKELSDAKALAAALKSQLAAAAAAEKDALARANELKQSLAIVEADRAAVQAARDALIAKHKAFIESL